MLTLRVEQVVDKEIKEDVYRSSLSLLYQGVLLSCDKNLYTRFEAALRASADSRHFDRLAEEIIYVGNLKESRHVELTIITHSAMQKIAATDNTHQAIVAAGVVSQGLASIKGAKNPLVDQTLFALIKVGKIVAETKRFSRKWPDQKDMLQPFYAYQL